MRAVLAASVGLGLVALIESALIPSRATRSAVGLGELVGVACGLALGGLQAVTLGRRRSVARLVWLACGGCAGLWVALQLGALPKLHGAHRTMATLVLVGAPCAGALLGAILCEMQAPLPKSRGRRVAAVAAWVGLGLTAVLAADMAATLHVLGGYPAAKRAVLESAWLCAGAAVGVTLRGFSSDARRFRIALALWGVTLLGQLPALVGLSSERAELLLQRPHAGAWLELVRSWSDFDGDGISGWFAGGDCAPFDARVSPTHPEIPGNGLDDNCRYGDAKKTAPRPSVAPQQPTGPLVSHVLLITVDALRADHLGVYGYRRPITPHLDAWSARARRFEHAYTSGGWTCLALNSLFHGVYPRRLRWDVVGATAKDRLVPFASRGRGASDDDVVIALSALAGSPGPSLPELLHAHGLATAAVIDGVVPPQLLDYKGWLDRSFQRVTRLKSDHDDQGATDQALRDMRELGDAPWFVWAHYFEPHYPPGRHVEVPELGTSMVDDYDRDVAYTDLQIGRLLDGIADPASTLVIVTADHGETFDAVIPSHGLDLDRAQIWIPLLIAGPGVAPGVEPAAASLVDLAPTILAATGSAPLSFADGVDLRGPLAADRIVLSDLWRRGLDGKLFMDRVAASTAHDSMIQDRLHQTTRASGGATARLDAAIGAYLEEPMQPEEVPP